MTIYGQFELTSKISDYINEHSSWKSISDYIMFLTLKNGGCSKSSSGSLHIHFPTHWDDDFLISAEIGGYDMPNMSRHEYFSAKSEEELKIIIITKLEEARIMIFQDSDEQLSAFEKAEKELLEKIEASSIIKDLKFSTEQEQQLKELREERAKAIDRIKEKLSHLI